MKISTVDEMRRMDQEAIQQYGIPEELLMENAGGAAYRLLQGKVDLCTTPVVVLCGGGNNGGDGLVVARHVASGGGDVTIVLLSDPARYSGAAAVNYNIVSAFGIDIIAAEGNDDIANLLQDDCVVVDALLGTGIERAVEGRYAQAVATINDSIAKVLSIDIPSGVNGNTGQVMGTAVQANWTVTFGLPKIGNLLYPGWSLGGELYVSHISFPPSLYDSDDMSVAVNRPSEVPPRDESGHKGTFGQALFIAGAASYYGAPYLSAMSYLKAGGGYARLAAPAGIVPTLATHGCEIVFIPQDETESGSISQSNLSDLLDLAERMDFVVIGPGLSLDPETQELLRQVVQSVDVPVLIDGDGISAVQDHLDCVRGRNAPTVLTPHLGEMSRLTGLSIEEIAQDSIATQRTLCQDLQATVVMKGAHTLIGEPGGGISVNLTGNSGMATAGSGDVLTGAIAAMHGLGLGLHDAVRTGVFTHGLAGDLAAADLGQDGMTASDVLGYLPHAMRTLRNGLPRRASSLGPVVI